MGAGQLIVAPRLAPARLKLGRGLWTFGVGAGRRKRGGPGGGGRMTVILLFLICAGFAFSYQKLVLRNE